MKNKFTYFLTAAALLASACQQRASEPVKQVGSIPDSVLVPYELANKYVTNYAPHAGYVGGLIGKDSDSLAIGHKPSIIRRPDTRCVWFSRDRLAQMLAKLDAEKGDGVRIYMMTYNTFYNPVEREKYKPLPPVEHWGYNSLLVVSTKDSAVAVPEKDSIHYHQDYYKYMNVGTKKNIATNKPGFIVTFVPENRGEMCPPPSDCFSIGATLLSN